MSEEDRMVRLEARVARLEGLLETCGGAAGQRGSRTAGQRGERAARHEPEHPGGSPTPTPPAAPLPRRPAAAPPRRPAALLSSEQWIGQRVLLAVGVVALILAAGYLLRLSFDRGWISPLMRCIGGALGRHRGRRGRLAAPIPLPHLWGGTDRLRRGDHIPECVGGGPALRRAPPYHRHRRPGAGVDRPGDDRVCHRRRSAGNYRCTRRLLRADPARSGSGQPRHAAPVPRLHGGGARPGGRAAALAAHHVRRCAQLLRGGL